MLTVKQHFPFRKCPTSTTDWILPGSLHFHQMYKCGSPATLQPRHAKFKEMAMLHIAYFILHPKQLEFAISWKKSNHPSATSTVSWHSAQPGCRLFCPIPDKKPSCRQFTNCGGLQQWQHWLSCRWPRGGAANLDVVREKWNGMFATKGWTRFHRLHGHEAALVVPFMQDRSSWPSSW